MNRHPGFTLPIQIQPCAGKLRRLSGCGQSKSIFAATARGASDSVTPEP